MDEVYDQLTSRAKSLLSATNSHTDTAPYRIVIALAGPPGSGKSTVAAEVVQRLNRTPGTGNAIVLPMDGFHLTRAELEGMPNKEEAFARRGVHWTYDAEGVISLAEALHATRADRSIVHLAPCFDHATKDPVENEIKITPEVNLVIMEGNWLLFDEEPWSKISQIVDDAWFVDVDSDLALIRVAKRHIQSGIESTWEDAIRRTKNNDMINGDLVRAKLIPPTIRVRSVEASIAS